MLARLVFALSLSGLLALGCDEITGEWINEKGSVLNITAHDGDLGAFDATFESAVALKDDGFAERGRRHVRGFYREGLLSYAVEFRHSMASFVGQCHHVKGGARIHITWLLRTPTKKAHEAWKGTRVGEDRFTRRRRPHILPDNLDNNDF